MRILGLSCFYHDSAACLVDGGRIVAAAEEERYTRLKHDAAFPANAITDCLHIGNLSASDVDLVVFYEKPLAKLERSIAFATAFPSDEKPLADSISSFATEQASLEPSLRKLGLRCPIEYCEHHLSHLASSYYISGFESAALLSLDGVGEWTTTAIGVGAGRDIRVIEELAYPHSLGLFYSTFTAYLGFKVNNDEYKVMGLSAYGHKTYVDELADVLRIHDDGRYSLGMHAFDFHRSNKRMFSEWLIQRFGPARRPESEMTDVHRDLAASVQELTSRCMLSLARRAHTLTGKENLCLSGGVALNCLGNQRIVEQGPFENVVIQPAAGDSGGAIGAALWGAAKHNDEMRVAPVPRYSSCLGPEYSDEEIGATLRACGASYRKHAPEDVCREVAKLLARGFIIAFFQGRMEFGPRALGCRSILASPLKAEMKEVINRRIKFREAFRPFAPVSTVEDAGTYFDIDRPYPHMLVTCRVREQHFATLPAITHEDGSARLQTIAADANPLYHGVIKEFGKLTGTPVLINTSFNVRGEPIVRTPEEAYRCFTLTDLDALVIGTHIVERLW